jgi:hypothetical protein
MVASSTAPVTQAIRSRFSLDRLNTGSSAVPAFGSVT